MTAANGKAGFGFQSGKAYGAFLAISLVVLFIMLAIGYRPTLEHWGRGAAGAVLAGCVIGLLGAIAGSLPILLSGGKPILERMPAIYASIGLRLAVVLALSLGVALSGAFEPKPLLLWVILSHTGLLLVDSTYTVLNLRAPLAPRVVEET